MLQCRVKVLGVLKKKKKTWRKKDHLLYLFFPIYIWCLKWIAFLVTKVISKPGHRWRLWGTTVLKFQISKTRGTKKEGGGRNWPCGGSSATNLLWLSFWVWSEGVVLDPKTWPGSGFHGHIYGIDEHKTDEQTGHYVALVCLFLESSVLIGYGRARWGIES